MVPLSEADGFPKCSREWAVRWKKIALGLSWGLACFCSNGSTRRVFSFHEYLYSFSLSRDHVLWETFLLFSRVSFRRVCEWHAGRCELFLGVLESSGPWENGECLS